jgi:hypothetical protein
MKMFLAKFYSAQKKNPDLGSTFLFYSIKINSHMLCYFHARMKEGNILRRLNQVYRLQDPGLSVNGIPEQMTTSL